MKVNLRNWLVATPGMEQFAMNLEFKSSRHVVATGMVHMYVEFKSLRLRCWESSRFKSLGDAIA